MQAKYNFWKKNSNCHPRYSYTSHNSYKWQENKTKPGRTSKFCEHFKTMTKVIISAKCENQQGENTLRGRTSKERGTARALADTWRHRIKALSKIRTQLTFFSRLHRNRGGRRISKPLNTAMIFLNASCSTQIQGGKNKLDLFGFTPLQVWKSRQENGTSSVSHCLKEKFSWYRSKAQDCSTHLQCSKTSSLLEIRWTPQTEQMITKIPKLVVNCMSIRGLRESQTTRDHQPVTDRVLRTEV